MSACLHLASSFPKVRSFLSLWPIKLPAAFCKCSSKNKPCFSILFLLHSGLQCCTICLLSFPRLHNHKLCELSTCWMSCGIILACRTLWIGWSLDDESQCRVCAIRVLVEFSHTSYVRVIQELNALAGPAVSLGEKEGFWLKHQRESVLHTVFIWSCMLERKLCWLDIVWFNSIKFTKIFPRKPSQKLMIW